MERHRHHTGLNLNALIGIDWGTTNLRAYRYDEQGRVLETRESANGILSIQNAAFSNVLADVCGDWLKLTPQAIVLMSGMIGSRQGWIEAPYVPCIASSATVAAQLTPVPDVAAARIVPGVTTTRVNGVHDVMRGEETQIFGAIDHATDALVIAPGTHSKWISVKRGAIVTFRTFMTGELYAVLRKHSILGRLMTQERHDPDAFSEGIRVSLEGDLASDLFSVRTMGLFATIAPEALASYLSGLLIGAEIHSALRGQNRLPAAVAGPVRIIATPALAESYREALAIAGILATTLVDSHEASARGLWNIFCLLPRSPGED